MDKYINTVDEILTKYFKDKDTERFSDNLKSLFWNIVNDNMIGEYLEGGIGKLLVVVRYLINKIKVYNYSGEYSLNYNSVFERNISLEIQIRNQTDEDINIDIVI